MDLIVVVYLRQSKSKPCRFGGAECVRACSWETHHPFVIFCSQYGQAPPMYHAPPMQQAPPPPLYQQPPMQQSSIQIPMGAAPPKVVSTACIYPTQPGESSRHLASTLTKHSSSSPSSSSSFSLFACTRIQVFDCYGGAVLL